MHSLLETMAGTPTVLLTGFFGSGKTTLINEWLRAQGPYKLGVVLNEFGHVGIDSALLGPGDIVELGGGCVCCATGSELWETADDLLSRTGATQLLIETSGIADPAVLLQQHQTLPDELRARFDIRSVTGTIDTTFFPQALAKRTEALLQIQQADRYLLTKADRTTPEQLATTHRMLDEQGCSTERALVSPRTTRTERLQLLAWMFAPHTMHVHHNRAHQHVQQLTAIPFSTDSFFVYTLLRDALERMQPSLLRLKGLVQCWDQGAHTWYEVQGAGETLQWKPFLGSPPSQSTLLLIGETTDETLVRIQLSACCLP